MAHHQSHTMRSGRRVPALLILGASVIATFSGCDSIQPMTGRISSHSLTSPSFADQDGRTNRPNNQTRVPDEVAAQKSNHDQIAHRETDPGARWLVRSLNARFDRMKREHNRPIQIGVTELQNQSKASMREFASFVERFVSLLSDAGETTGIQFTSETDADVQYVMHGTAYLVIVDGIEMWELFPTLSRANRPRMIWQLSDPVRVVRRPGPNQPQILIMPSR